MVASLFSLPDELLMQVIKDPGLARKDLVNLRATCQRIRRFAAEVLAKKYLNAMALDFEPGSIKRLSRRCSSDFGPHLCRISFTFGKMFDYQHYETAQMRSVFTGLKEIRIKQDYFAKVFCGKKILKHAEHLEVLEINLRNRHHPFFARVGFDAFIEPGKIVRRISSDSLSSLSLERLCISTKDLNQLLSRHQHTLRKVELCSIALAKGIWPDVFRVLQHDFISLDQLSLCGLCTAGRMREGVYYPEIYPLEPLMLVSQKEIQAGLTAHLEGSMT